MLHDAYLSLRRLYHKYGVLGPSVEYLGHNLYWVAENFGVGSAAHVASQKAFSKYLKSIGLNEESAKRTFQR